MVESVFYPVLRDIDEQKKAVELHLANGGAKTQEDYWRLVGGYEAISRVEGYAERYGSPLRRQLN
jgi:hypothetical protein